MVFDCILTMLISSYLDLCHKTAAPSYWSECTSLCLVFVDEFLSKFRCGGMAVLCVNRLLTHIINSMLLFASAEDQISIWYCV